MRKIVIEMLKIYQPLSNLDWLNYKIVQNSELTYHHIVKKCDGGKKTISNGAILLPTTHQYLHLIEHMDLDTYITINNLFKEINAQKQEPTMTQRYVLEEILEKFEKEHKWDKGNNGEILIKRKYLKRW